LTNWNTRINLILSINEGHRRLINENIRQAAHKAAREKQDAETNY